MSRTGNAAIGGVVLVLALCAPGEADAAPAGWIATSIDTMKESLDRSDDPTTQAQIDQHVAELAALNPTHITVDVPMDRPARYAMWVDSIRAHSRKVWHRPMEWGYPDPPAATDVGVTPAIYLDHLRQFILQNSELFRPGDILDGDSEADGNAYWRRFSEIDWWNLSNPPLTLTYTQACDEFNRYLLDLTSVADDALAQSGVTGVETRVRSLNPWWATANCLKDDTIAALGGYLTIDAADEAGRPGGTTAAVVAGEWDLRLETWHAYRPKATIVFGEYGYANDMAVDDTTQAQVLSAVLDVIGSKPYVNGLNYWVGAGGPGRGGYTNILTGTSGAWSPRPAAFEIARFYAAH
jgi:hypothetical protein